MFLVNLMNWMQSGKSVQVHRDIKPESKRIKNSLDENGENFYSILRDLESSKTKEDVIRGLKKLNGLMRFLRRIVPQQEHFKAIREAIEDLGISEKFRANLQREITLDDALISYKTEVLQFLAVEQRMIEKEDERDDKLDKELLDRFLPNLKSKEEEEVKEHNFGNSRKRRRVQIPSSGRRKNVKLNEVLNAGRRQMCIFFEEGKCLKGKKCKFEHISID